MWPQKPENVHQIPHTQSVDDHGGLVDRVDEATERGLLELVYTFHDDLEKVTLGDLRKEQIMGDLLIRSAVYAANRRQRSLEGHPVG